MQALFALHSELTVHSGRQLGGVPTYVGKQLQRGMPLFSSQRALEPHGDGTHELLSRSGTSKDVGSESKRVI